jgi:hypothetical protein
MTIRKFLSFIKKYILSLQRNILYFEKILIFERESNITIKNLSNIKLSFKFTSENELDLLDEKKYFLNKKRKKYLFDRLKKGDKCLLAIFKKEIIGYLWIMYNEMELSDKEHISLPNNKVYQYNGYVINQYRGKRIIGALREYFVEKLKNDGKKYLYISIPSNNTSSIKGLNDTGKNKMIGNFFHIKFLFFKYNFISKKLLRYIQKK